MRLGIKIALACLIVAGGTVLYGYYRYTQETDIGEQTVTVIVKPGDSFSSLADSLVAHGVVSSRLLLTFPARLIGIDKKLIPGRYDFSHRNSCRSVLEKFQRADFVMRKVTIPEGSPIWKVAGIISRALDLDSARFIALNTDTAFLQRLNLPCLEGYLFPETYIFKWGIREEEVVQALVAQFHRMTDSLWSSQEIIDNLTPHEIVTLASIIEAETSLDEERRTISSVYHNRLRRKMKLDADPTVIYGLGGLDRPLTRRDLKVDTPYNTYLHKGLPPTPINSPGLAAIRAALYPEETDYLFFVANNIGGHFFSRTNSEHNRAKRKAKRIKKEQTR